MKNKKIKLKRISPMYKRVNGKRFSICDYHGNCFNKAYREVYPMLMGGSGWNYLCRKHFESERKRLKNKLAYCTID